jgi:hypothetical protein
MAQLVTHRPLIAKTHFLSEASACDIYGWLIDTEIGFFSWVLRFSLVTIIPLVLHTRLLLRVALTRWKNGRNVGPPKEHSLWNRGVSFKKSSFFFCRWVVSPLTLTLTFLPNLYPLSSNSWNHVSCLPDVPRSVSKESVDKISLCVSNAISRVVKTECGRSSGGQALVVQPTSSLRCQFWL